MISHGPQLAANRVRAAVVRSPGDLANRVLVFSPRPARITAEFKVDLTYPRHRGDARLANLRRDILGALGLAADW